ncbi:MAG: hypothetical protein Q9164_005531 [Protoblastenia rupestris]
MKAPQTPTLDISLPDEICNSTCPKIQDMIVLFEHLAGSATDLMQRNHDFFNGYVEEGCFCISGPRMLDVEHYTDLFDEDYFYICGQGRKARIDAESVAAGLHFDAQLQAKISMKSATTDDISWEEENVHALKTFARHSFMLVLKASKLVEEVYAFRDEQEKWSDKASVAKIDEELSKAARGDPLSVCPLCGIYKFWVVHARAEKTE